VSSISSRELLTEALGNNPRYCSGSFLRHVAGDRQLSVERSSILLNTFRRRCGFT